jgi:hypothetical protein
MTKIKLHNPVLAENSTFGNFSVESLATDPNLTSVLSTGRIWFNSAEKRFKGAFLNTNSTSVDIMYLAQHTDIININNTITTLEAKLDSTTGALTDLTTTAKNNLVAAIDELDGEIGDLSALTTTAKNTIVASINTLDFLLGKVALPTTATTVTGAIAEHESDIGHVQNLTTTATNLTSAVNELDSLLGKVVLTTTAHKVTNAVNELDALLGKSVLTTTATTVTAALVEHESDIGHVESLTTTAKNLTDAVNEINTAKVARIDIVGKTVGSNTLIPVITYNNQGQITATTTAPVTIDLQGVTDIGNTSNNEIILTDGVAGTTAGLTADFLTTSHAVSAGSLGVTANAHVGGTLDVTGNATVGTLTAGVTTILYGDTTIANDGTNKGNLIIQGNLTVKGATTTVDTEILKVADNIITLNSNAVGAPTENAGLEVNRGNLGTQTIIQFNETTDTVQVAVWNKNTSQFEMIDVASANNNKDILDEIDAVEASLGFGGPLGTVYTATSNNYIAGLTVTADVSKLDTELKRVENGAGNWLSLTTTAKTLTTAVNELDAELGPLGDLTTTLKSTFGAAINEVDQHANNLYTTIGSYVTTDATSLNITGTNYLNSATTISTALSTLDTTLKTRADNLGVAAGTVGDVYTADAASHYLKATAFTAASKTASLFNADLLLDTQLFNTNTNIGVLTNLTTDTQTTIVAAINEVDLHANHIYTALGTAIAQDGTVFTVSGTTYLGGATTVAETFSAIDTNLKRVEDGVGDWTTLTTVHKTVTTAINELDALLGKTVLSTTAKTVTPAINELDTRLNAEVLRATTTEGTLASLNTTVKTNLVAAINSEVARANTAESNLTTRLNKVNTAAGITNDTYTANATTNYLTSATSLFNADELLDAKLKATIVAYAGTTKLTQGTSLIGYKGYTETDLNIVNPTVEIVAGTLESAIDDIVSSVNLKIHELENRYVKAEVAQSEKSDTYTVVHNLDTLFVDVSVQVYDETDLAWRFDLVVVEVVDANTVTISLAAGIAQQIRYVVHGY